MESTDKQTPSLNSALEKIEAGVRELRQALTSFADGVAKLGPIEEFVPFCGEEDELTVDIH